MRRILQSIIALFMAALWLPATQHCTLDALGIIEAHVIHHDRATDCPTHGEETQHAHDTCVLVEFSSWLDTAAPLDAPPPQISRHTPVNAAPRPDTLSRPPPIFQPRDPAALSPVWIPSRHFTERAAPISRAPSPTLT
jgi:hypothetical protein